MGGRWSVASSGSCHALPSGDLTLKASSGRNDSSRTCSRRPNTRQTSRAHVLAPERVMSAKSVTRGAGSQPGDRKDRLLEDRFRDPHFDRRILRKIRKISMVFQKVRTI